MTAYEYAFWWVNCPYCDAIPGKPCQSRSGKVLAWSHAKRINRYHDLATVLAWDF